MVDWEGRKWRGDGAGAEPHRPASSSRGKKAFVLAAVMLALGGAALAWMLYVRPMVPPYFLSLPVREYEAAELPVNSLVVQDSDLLAQHFPEDQRQKAYESQTGERLRLELQKLRARTGPVVVHLCALARGPAPAAVRSGEAKDDDVFLLPGNADPGEPKTWLSLREVLQVLAQCPSRHKLLLLDIMRPLADPRVGVAADDIGTRVQDLLEREPPNDFLVLCACGRGQLSLVSENLKQSLFAYYLDQGLRGPADGLGPHGREDRRVTVTELAAFVQQRVDRWARRQRSLTQTPVLVGKGEDFPLVHLDQSAPGPAPEWQELATVPTWIRAGWEMHDRWWSDDSFRLVPNLFREMELALLRAEERWLGGIEEERVKDKLKSELDALEVQRKKARDLPRCEPASLALLARGTPAAKDDPALEEALKTLLARTAELTAKPGELDKGLAPFKEKFKAQALLPLGRTALELVRKLPSPSAGQVLVLREAIRSLHPDASYAEVLFLQRLVDFRQRVEDNEWTWPAAAVHQVLRTMLKAEAALAALTEEPEFLARLGKLFEEADEDRRFAEKGLFSGRPSGWDQATERSRRAENKYGEILDRRLDNLRRAQRDLDQALVLLPGLAPFLSSLPQVGGQEHSAWKGAIQEGKKLGDLFRGDDPALGAVELDHDLELRQHVRVLENFFRERRQRFLARAGQGSPADLQDFFALRATPRSSAVDRASLWQAGQALARQLAQPIEELDRAGDNTTSSTPAQAEVDVPRKRQLGYAVDLLRLGGFAGVEDLQAQQDKATSASDWSDLALALRTAWMKKLPEQLLASEKDLARADRLSRIVALGHARAADPAHWSQSPRALLARHQAQDFLRWLSKRYRDESLALPPGSTLATFYAQAAEKCAP